MATTQNTAARREPVSQAIVPQRQLRPVNGDRNAFAGREPQVDRLAILTSQVRRDPLANASRGNELCMQDFI
jgi:hypothetical protein